MTQGGNVRDITLSISANQLEANIMLRDKPPEEGVITENDVLDEINRDGRVTFGLDIEAIRKAIYGNVRGEWVCIAKGIEPVKGDDAQIEVLFETEHDLKPTILEDGSVDYKSLNLFEDVVVGQELVRKIPATSGLPGTAVTGKPIPPKPGRDKPMLKGKNVEFSEDGLTMISACDGRVDIVDGKVVVSTCFEIKSDADMSVGNTDFNGDIVIKGGVISGLTIRGTGNVEIFGIVEGARIEAGNDIILHQGMLGNDSGVLSAGGRVYSRFIERATVSAVGDVTADTIVHSTINSEGNVKAIGKRGVIIGGTIRANVGVVAQTLGSTSCTPTIIEVGISPEQRMRMIELENEKMELSSNARRLDMRSRSFETIPVNDNTEERVRLLKTSALRERMINQKKLSEVSSELERIKAIAEEAKGRVHVLRTVFPGVQIIISPMRYLVTKETQFVTYKKSEGEIIFVACEYREGDDSI